MPPAMLAERSNTSTVEAAGRATVVERFHPMMTGFVRVRPRTDRRAGCRVDTRWAHLRRRVPEIARMLSERQKKAEKRKKETDKERRKTLKKEIKELDKKSKELGKKIKKDIDKEVKDLKKVGGKAGAGLTNIKKLIGEIAKALGESFDDGLIDAFAKLLACLRKTATVLAKLKVKLIVLRDLEALVKKLIKKLT